MSILLISLLTFERYQLFKLLKSVKLKLLKNKEIPDQTIKLTKK